MRLSLKMGIPIRRLQHEVDSRDFALYQAYDRIDPQGMERFDRLAGIVCDTLAKLHGVKKTKPADFMVDWDAPEKKKKTAEQMYNMFKMFCASTGGKIVGEEKRK